MLGKINILKLYRLNMQDICLQQNENKVKPNSMFLYHQIQFYKSQFYEGLFKLVLGFISFGLCFIYQRNLILLV